MIISIIVILLGIALLGVAGYLLYTFVFSWPHALTILGGLVLSILGVILLVRALTTIDPAAALAVGRTTASLPVDTQTTATSNANGCVAKPGNYGGGQQSTIVVPAGHRRILQWWSVEDSQQRASMLDEGTWTPAGSVYLGAYWDYPACSAQVVDTQLRANNPVVVEASTGFSR